MQWLIDFSGTVWIFAIIFTSLQYCHLALPLALIIITEISSSGMSWHNVSGIGNAPDAISTSAMNKLVVMRNGMKPHILFQTLNEMALVRPSSLSSAVSRVAGYKPLRGSQNARSQLGRLTIVCRMQNM